jgi:O-antigen/teichoic acid export membrane protein
MNPPRGDVQGQPFALRRRSLAKLIEGRQHLLVAGSAWVSRVVMALAQLAAIRVLMGSLGVEKYAMFALLMGLLQWYMLSDLGLGISIQNRISACRAKKQPYDEVIVVAGRIAIVLLVLSILVLYFVSPYLAEHFLRAFPSISSAEKASNFFLTGALFIGAGIGNISYKIWYAEQRGYWAHLLPAAASVLGLIGLIILGHDGRQHSIWAAILIFNAPATLLPLGSLVLQVIGQPYAFRTLDFALIKKTLSSAAKFWVTTILATAALQLDYLIISQILSPHQIVVYVVATKIFGFVAFFFTSLLWALWPKFAESVSCGEWDQVRQLRASCLRLGAILVVGSTIALAFTMPYISRALAPGQAITIPLQLTLLLGVLQLTRAWSEVYTVILQSMNMLWPFWLLIPIQTVLSAIFQYSLAPIYGTQGIVLGLIAALILTTNWGLPLVMKRHLERSQHR